MCSFLTTEMGKKHDGPQGSSFAETKLQNSVISKGSVRNQYGATQVKQISSRTRVKEAGCSLQRIPDCVFRNIFNYFFGLFQIAIGSNWLDRSIQTAVLPRVIATARDILTERSSLRQGTNPIIYRLFSILSLSGTFFGAWRLVAPER